MAEMVILQIEQIKALQRDWMITTIEELREDLKLNFWEEELTVEQVAEDLKVSKATVYNWKGLKKPLVAIPFQGQPERITRREARAWFSKYSNVYKGN
jgi:hypothetical protein